MTKKQDTPKVLEQMDFDPLICTVQDCIENGNKRGDSMYWIFRYAVEAVYGDDIWKWLDDQNKKG